MSTIAITGAASGIGAATAARLTEHGHRIGVDLRRGRRADLGRSDGRWEAIARSRTERRRWTGWSRAGLAGPNRPVPLLISVNYFGTVELLAGLAPTCGRHRARGGRDQLRATTTQPGIPMASSACRRRGCGA
jgi:nucleoside-diphosphate-sugar epimerase